MIASRTLLAVLVAVLLAVPAAAHHKDGHTGGKPDGVKDRPVKPDRPGKPDLPGGKSGRFVVGTIAEGANCSEAIDVDEGVELTLRGGPKRLYLAPEDLLVETFGDFAHVCLWDEAWIAERELKFVYHFTRLDEEGDEGEPETEG